jgi:hypothetical protein
MKKKFTNLKEFWGDKSFDDILLLVELKEKELKEKELIINEIIHEPILEMARINDIKEFPYDVFVYGGNSYGSGRNEHGYPHFHFSDKIKGGKWSCSILIPTVEEWYQNKQLYIYEPLNGDYNWTGLKKEKKLLIEWLDKKNNFDPDKSNLEFIRLQWNVLNIDNKNVSQIKRIK